MSSSAYKPPKPEIQKAKPSKLPLRINKEVWFEDYQYIKKTNVWEKINVYGVLSCLSENGKTAFIVYTHPNGKVDRYARPVEFIWQSDENRKA